MRWWNVVLFVFFLFGQLVLWRGESPWSRWWSPIYSFGSESDRTWHSATRAPHVSVTDVYDCRFTLTCEGDEITQCLQRWGNRFTRADVTGYHPLKATMGGMWLVDTRWKRDHLVVKYNSRYLSAQAIARSGKTRAEKK